MTVINEIQRIKLGFNTMEFGGNAEQRQYPNFGYHEAHARKLYFTFALEEVGETRQWVHIDNNLRGNFNIPDIYGFKVGPAFQAEMGLRLVDGKRLSAEAYLDSLCNLPAADPGLWSEQRLVADLVVKKEDEARLKDGRFDSYTFDTQTCSVVEDGEVLRIAVPLVNLNNLLLVESSPWHEEGKKVRLHRALTLNDQCQEAPPAHIGGETLELF